MSYLTFVHACLIPRGTAPPERNPGLGSVWRCDDCRKVFTLWRVSFPAGDEPADLSWVETPPGTPP